MVIKRTRGVRRGGGGIPSVRRTNMKDILVPRKYALKNVDRPIIKRGLNLK